MNIIFADQEIEVRTLTTQPRKFKVNDFVMGPKGNLLRVATVQNDCPIWESNRKTKCAVVFELEDGTIVPESNCFGTFTIYRPRRPFSIRKV